jgi:hypothetical protein
MKILYQSLNVLRSDVLHDPPSEWRTGKIDPGGSS